MILRPRHFKAIDYIVGTDQPTRVIARAVGVSPRTIQCWLKDEEFQAELQLRQDLTADRLERLRMQTARCLYVNILKRLQQEDEHPTLREMTQLLARLMADPLFAGSRDLARVRMGIDPGYLDDWILDQEDDLRATLMCRAARPEPTGPIVVDAEPAAAP